MRWRLDEPLLDELLLPLERFLLVPLLGVGGDFGILLSRISFLASVFSACLRCFLVNELKFAILLLPAGAPEEPAG